MKRTIRPEGVPSDTPYTPAVEVNGLIFISGQIANVKETRQLRTGNIAEETKQVMENLGEVLKAAGLDHDDLVKCTVYLTNMQQYAEMNRVYLSFFKGDPPARETIAIKELPRMVNVEISGIAYRK
jgi:2-iminobutanoate/2-iminopropanoate deaminase